VGYYGTARELARANLAEVQASGARRLLVLGPGDFFTFSTLYAERLGIELPLDWMLHEVIAVLAERLAHGGLRFRPAEEPRPWAYVDPTHTVRVPGRVSGPRALLAAVMPTPGRELYWRGDRAQAAGNVALQFTQPAIAEKLTRARLQDARATGAQVLFCEDPGSLAHLARFAPEYGLEVRGLYEWLAAHLA
jgi:Fe-S oxidoreductase